MFSIKTKFANRKIGIFDSGLGGLLITKAIHKHLPKYDIVYLGDTLHVPYGKHSADAIYNYTKRGMEYLFTEAQCELIILACNTASAAALRKLQQEYLPHRYPDRRILGVVVPTLETCIDRSQTTLGLIGTDFVIKSGIYEEELKKLNPKVKIHSKETPLLASMIEQGGVKWIKPILEEYLEPLKEKKIESLILGCTHYACLKKEIKDYLGEEVDLISQDDIIPPKLEDYLERHPEIERNLSRKNNMEFLITDKTDSFVNAAKDLYDPNIEVEMVTI